MSNNKPNDVDFRFRNKRNDLALLDLVHIVEFDYTDHTDVAAHWMAQEGYEPSPAIDAIIAEKNVSFREKTRLITKEYFRAFMEAEGIEPNEFTAHVVHESMRVVDTKAALKDGEEAYVRRLMEREGIEPSEYSARVLASDKLRFREKLSAVRHPNLWPEHAEPVS